MTAIDMLLQQAGAINATSVKALSPALEEMAFVQAGVADALEPLFEAIAGVAGAQPFRYGFVLPAEPPEFKADPTEPALSHGKTEVTLGPINVYSIAGEIQKALDSVGQDSTNLQGVFSTYTPRPAALPASTPRPEEPGQRMPPAATQLKQHLQRAGPRLEPEAQERAMASVDSRQTAIGRKRKVVSEERVEASPQQWVEDSIRRSGVVLKDLREVQESIINSTITTEKVRGLSEEALSIGQAASMGSAPPRLPEKPATEEEPARPAFIFTPHAGARPAPAEARMPPVRPENGSPWAGVPQVAGRETHSDITVSDKQGTARTTKPATAGAPEKPAFSGQGQAAITPPQEARETLLPGTVKAPTIRLRPNVMTTPSEDSDFNARSLSRALSMGAESGRSLPEAGPARQEREQRPAKVEWPVISNGSSDRQPIPDAGQHGETGRQTWSGPSRIPEVRYAEAGGAGSPVIQVIRSFGAMGEALRAVSEAGAATAFALPAAVVPPVQAAGVPILNAMSGAAPVPHLENQEIGRLSTTAGIGPAASPAYAGSGNVSPTGGSSSPVVVFAPGAGAQAVRPGWSLAASISAAQASQRSGAAMIQRLIQAAPQVAGSIPTQAPVIYDSGRGMPFTAPVTPAAASGAENIVNITVPQAAQSKAGESSTTTRVANFHNTFNITVNLQSAEERDLKDLGKKIGQLLSEELKRYGGLS